MSKVVEALDRLLQGDMCPEARELLQRAKAVESNRAFWKPDFRRQVEDDDRFKALVALGIEGGRSYDEAVDWAVVKWREGMTE